MVVVFKALMRCGLGFASDGVQGEGVPFQNGPADFPRGRLLTGVAMQVVQW